AMGARVNRETNQPRQYLHVHILEVERRTMEKFKQKRIDADLAQRRHGRMTKIAIGLAGKPGEIAGCNRGVGKRADDLDRNLGIGAAGKTRDRPGVEARPSVWHIKPAIAGKPGEHYFGQADPAPPAPP